MFMLSTVDLLGYSLDISGIRNRINATHYNPKGEWKFHSALKIREG